MCINRTLSVDPQSLPSTTNIKTENEMHKGVGIRRRSQQHLMLLKGGDALSTYVSDFGTDSEHCHTVTYTAFNVGSMSV